MAEDKEMNEQDKEKMNEEQDVQDAASAGQQNEMSAEEKIAELNDRFLRLYAEFDNYRKRTNKEKVELITNAAEGVLKDMLPVLDDFERAISNNEKAEDIESVKEGFQLIYHKFRMILESKGLKPMHAKGEAFDSELHEAIANVPTANDEDKGKVIDDVEKGYYLHEKVIRFAKVVVGQ